MYAYQFRKNLFILRILVLCSIMEWEWLKSGIGPVKDLISFLNKESKTADIIKRQLLRELRDNLNIFQNGFRNHVDADVLIDMLSNDAIEEALAKNFRFRKLKAGKVRPDHVHDERNRRYAGWDAEKLVDKIDEKIEELKNIKKMNKGTVKNAKNNISLMLSNLFFRMKLLADFIQAKK